MLGRSNLVGKPMTQLLLRENATVTICHRVRGTWPRSLPAGTYSSCPGPSGDGRRRVREGRPRCGRRRHIHRRMTEDWWETYVLRR